MKVCAISVLAASILLSGFSAAAEYKQNNNDCPPPKDLSMCGVTMSCPSHCTLGTGTGQGNPNTNNGGNGGQGGDGGQATCDGFIIFSCGGHGGNGGDGGSGSGSSGKDPWYVRAIDAVVNALKPTPKPKP